MNALTALQQYDPNSLGQNIAMAARSRQRAFDAAAAGDPEALRSQSMARPEDDLLNEALFEQGATVGRGSQLGNQAIGMNNPALVGLQASSPANPAAVQARRRMMLNQDQPAANFYPNASNFPYKPY